MKLYLLYFLSLLSFALAGKFLRFFPGTSPEISSSCQSDVYEEKQCGATIANDNGNDNQGQYL